MIITIANPRTATIELDLDPEFDGMVFINQDHDTIAVNIADIPELVRALSVLSYVSEAL
jgi:hypothetical protein